MSATSRLELPDVVNPRRLRLAVHWQLRLADVIDVCGLLELIWLTQLVRRGRPSRAREGMFASMMTQTSGVC
jgi:hypothetical protein